MKMGIIQKRADELKPGDVLPTQSGICSFPYMVIRGSSRKGSEWVYHYVCAVDKDAPYVFEAKFAADIVCNVESPDLTLAQQHAEELLALVRKMAGVFKYSHTMSDADVAAHGKAYVEMAHEVLAKIDPPEPPTLAEALESLDALTSETSHMPKARDYALGLLDRARRAGVL
jgi:hypothetical protein